jgi:hypothetical protein
VDVCCAYPVEGRPQNSRAANAPVTPITRPFREGILLRRVFIVSTTGKLRTLWKPAAFVGSSIAVAKLLLRKYQLRRTDYTSFVIAAYLVFVQMCDKVMQLSN